MISAAHEVDDVFRQVRGVVGDPLEVPGCRQHVQEQLDRIGVGTHLVGQDREHLVMVVVDLVVRGDHDLGAFGVLIDERIEAEPHHPLHGGCHVAQVHRQPDLAVTRQDEGPLGDVPPEITHAFEIVVDLEHGRDETKVTGHRLVQRQELQTLLFDLDLLLIDLFFDRRDIPSRGRCLAP